MHAARIAPCAPQNGCGTMVALEIGQNRPRVAAVRRPNTMSVALKNCIRLSVLTLVVAGLSGCGAENPMGPSALAVSPTLETSAVMMPVEELPAPGDGNETITPLESPSGSTISGKTLWTERPGRRLGHGRNK
jgi:hypothetical protein